MELSEKAKEIINKILYITIATVSKDGQPWNTPVYCAFDKDYNFYWISDQNGQHSKNIAENDKVFLVIYDSTVPEGTGEGVYIKAKAYKLERESEAQEALECIDKRISGRKHSVEQFVGEMPRRVYKAVPEKFWMNGDGDVNGNYVDTRTEVDLI